MNPLDRLLAPRHVAVAGASDRPDSLGGVVLDNLHRFAGGVAVVHPRGGSVRGHRATLHPSDLSHAPDLAVIAVPRSAVAASVDAFLARGTRAFVILTAGFAESGDTGRDLETRVAGRIRDQGGVLLGPNSMGLHVAHGELRLDAGFSRALPEPGPVAIISQSGSITEWILARLVPRSVGVTLAASLGNRALLDDAALLGALPDRFPGVRTVLWYAESVPTAEEVTRVRLGLGPDRALVLLRGEFPPGDSGRHHPAPSGAAPLIPVDSLSRAADVLELRSAWTGVAGRRVAIVANAGGPARLAHRTLSQSGVSMPNPSAGLLDRVAQFLPETAVPGNPLDLSATATAGLFARAVTAVAGSGEYDVCLVVFMHPLFRDAEEVAREVAEAVSATSLPTAAVWMGDADARGADPILRRAGIPVFETPESGARAVAAALPPSRDRKPGTGPDRNTDTHL